MEFYSLKKILEGLFELFNPKIYNLPLKTQNNYYMTKMQQKNQLSDYVQNLLQRLPVQRPATKIGGQNAINYKKK